MPQKLCNTKEKEHENQNKSNKKPRNGKNVNETGATRYTS
jgi:hypothetical protein